MVGGDIFTQATRVNEMTKELRFEKAVLVGTVVTALFLYLAQGIG